MKTNDVVGEGFVLMKMYQAGPFQGLATLSVGTHTKFYGHLTRGVQVGCACLLLLLAMGQVHADAISMPLSQEFSGATAPVGASPWLTATLDDENTPGTVVFTLETTNLTGSEFVSGMYLNIDPTMDPADLSFSAATKTGTFDDPTISLSTDAFQADGDGKYDILFEFSTSSGSEFGVGEEVEYTITGSGSAAGLVAADFAFLSAPAGGKGPFHAAAHVQGIGAGGAFSGWIAPGSGFNPVPEPTSIVLLSLGLVFVAGRRQRR